MGADKLTVHGAYHNVGSKEVVVVFSDGSQIHFPADDMVHIRAVADLPWASPIITLGCPRFRPAGTS